MKNFAKTVSRFLLCERLSDWAKLGLRVFVGFMMLTHGIAKIEQFDTLKSTFPATMGMSSELSLILIILVEVGCSSLVLFGFMTRLAVLPLLQLFLPFLRLACRWQNYRCFIWEFILLYCLRVPDDTLRMPSS